MIRIFYAFVLLCFYPSCFPFKFKFLFTNTSVILSVLHFYKSFVLIVPLFLNSVLLIKTSRLWFHPYTDNTRQMLSSPRCRYIRKEADNMIDILFYHILLSFVPSGENLLKRPHSIPEHDTLFLPLLLVPCLTEHLLLFPEKNKQYPLNECLILSSCKN